MTCADVRSGAPVRVRVRLRVRLRVTIRVGLGLGLALITLVLRRTAHTGLYPHPNESHPTVALAPTVN